MTEPNQTLANAVTHLTEAAYRECIDSAVERGITPLQIASGMSLAVFVKVLADFVDKTGLQAYLESLGALVDELRHQRADGTTVHITADDLEAAMASGIQAFDNLGRDAKHAAHIMFLLVLRADQGVAEIREAFGIVEGD